MKCLRHAQDFPISNSCLPIRWEARWMCWKTAGKTETRCVRKIFFHTCLRWERSYKVSRPLLSKTCSEPSRSRSPGMTRRPEQERFNRVSKCYCCYQPQIINSWRNGKAKDNNLCRSSTSTCWRNGMNHPPYESWQRMLRFNYSWDLWKKRMRWKSSICQFIKLNLLWIYNISAQSANNTC